MTKTLRFDEIALSIADRVDDPTSAGVTQYVGLEHLDPDSIEITRFGTPEDVSATKLRFYPGDVIYARRRAYQKKLGVARFEGICSAHALVLRARAESCLPGFLPYFLHSDQFHNRALEISVGSLSPTINWSTLKHQVFRMPSLDEQERILELLSAVDAHAEALRNQVMVVQDTRRVIMSDLLSAGGEGWIETTLGDIAEYINGYPFKPGDLGDDGTAVIRIKQLLDPLEKVDRTTAAVPERCVLSNGDIVFSWSGTLAVRVWNRGHAYLNQHLFRVVEKTGVSHEWLPLVIDHAIKDLLEKSHGTTMKHITKQTLLPHQVFLPPLDEQQRIVDEISKIDALLQETNSALLATQQLRSALLNKEIS